MRNRLIVLMATVALLLVGAVPVSAAPGGVPGPPPGHGKSDVVKGDKVTPDGDEKQNGPPEWANAYGRHIKNAYGIPYGHVQQCLRAAPGDTAADGDEVAAGDEVSDDGEAGVKKALENCPEADRYMVPEGPGAKAFWTANEFLFITEGGLPILGL